MRENMVRTQVYLPRNIYERLQKRAKDNDLTLAVQIREALEGYLEQLAAAEGPILRADDPIFEMIGMFASAEGDLSVNHDHYLYGAPKREQRTKYSNKRRQPARKRKRS